MLRSVDWFQLPLSHKCIIFLRVSKWSLFFDMLLGFCDNNTGIACTAFKLTDRSSISCLHCIQEPSNFFDIFLSCISIWRHKKIFSPEDNFLISFNEVICEKCFISFSPNELCNSREHICHIYSFRYSNTLA